MSGREACLVHDHVWSMDMSGRETCLEHEHVWNKQMSVRETCLVRERVWSMDMSGGVDAGTGVWESDEGKIIKKHSTY